MRHSLPASLLFHSVALPVALPVALSLALSLASAGSLGCSSTTPGRGLGDGGVGVPPATSGDPQNGSGGVATCSSLGDECYCSYAGTGGGNGTSCDSRSVPNGLCCADVGWPDKNLG